MNYIVGIDPGNIDSAYCICDQDLRPVRFAKLENKEMFQHMLDGLQEIMGTIDPDTVVIAIEKVASYGMPVGREVFDTVEWIGYMKAMLEMMGLEWVNVLRRDEKLTICNSPRANDATIRQALIDRFAYGVSNKGKGTKKEPGWFYGFRADVWQAYAVAVTYHDMNTERK